MDVYKSIIIAGHKGMLASALIEALKARGLTAVCVDREECDITDEGQVARLFADNRPTLLINCAAYTAVDRAEDEPELANAINGKAVGILSRLSREYRTCITHFSTDFVFNGQSDRPYRPEDQPNPISAYGASKLLGERMIQEAAPPGWLIIRTAWLFGRRGNCFPQTMVKMAMAGKPLRVVNDQIGSPTYTIDLVDATLRLIDRKASGIFHVTNSGVTSWYDFAAESLRQFGMKGDLAPVSTADWVAMRPKQAKRPLYSAMDGSRYSAATGQVMRDWHDALAHYRASFGDRVEFP